MNIKDLERVVKTSLILFFISLSTYTFSQQRDTLFIILSNKVLENNTLLENKHFDSRVNENDFNNASNISINIFSNPNLELYKSLFFNDSISKYRNIIESSISFKHYNRIKYSDLCKKDDINMDSIIDSTDSNKNLYKENCNKFPSSKVYITKNELEKADKLYYDSLIELENIEIIKKYILYKVLYINLSYISDQTLFFEVKIDNSCNFINSRKLKINKR